MPTILFPKDPVFLQRFLRVGGYYKGDIDGLIGPKSLTALEEFETDSRQVADELGRFHKRSEAAIATMLLPTQRAARRFHAGYTAAGLSAGMTMRMLSGTRTYAEQALLYEKYQAGGPQAARPGYSNHNFGIAWDVGVFNAAGEYIDDLIETGQMTSKAVDAEYKKLGAYGKTLGLYWGGDWKKADYPHYQLRDNDDLAAVRDEFTNGGSLT